MKSVAIRFIPLLALIISVISCKKDTITDFYTSSEDMTTHQSFDLIIDDDADESLVFFTGESTISDRGCGTITYKNTKGTFPNVITIDYGASCIDLNGREKKGKIIINISDDLRNQGAVRTITTDNFYIDGVKIEGTRTLTNTGLDINGYRCFTRFVDNQKLTFSDGRTATWSSNTKLCQTKGVSTKERLDDEFSITGTANGVNRNGKTFSSEITESLIKRTICPWFVDGICKISDAVNTVSVDYGDGTCDKKAIVTLPNGNTKEILIKKWW